MDVIQFYSVATSNLKEIRWFVYLKWLKILTKELRMQK